jgi:hypothetical protein
VILATKKYARGLDLKFGSTAIVMVIVTLG